MANLIKFAQMDYKQLNIDDISFFKAIIGAEYVFTDNQSIFNYSHDETEDLSFPPEVVLKPVNSEEISKVLRYCNIKNRLKQIINIFFISV